MSAIRVGANLSMVWPRFALWLVADELPQRATPRVRPECAAAIADVAALYQEWSESGENPDRERWRPAAHAADAYTYTAYAAGAAASAGYAAYSVDAGAYAAYSPGYAAWAADDRIKCYQRMADKLIEILEAA